MNISSAINSAGGLYYHLTAFRYRKKLWQDFRNDISNKIHQWQQKHNEILILGGSGGYTLPKSKIAEYEKVTLVDPDPLAPIIFRRRFNRPVHWVDYNFLSKGAQGLLEIEDLLKNKDFLMANLIGQLPLICPNHIQNGYHLRDVLKKVLENKNWFSYHDCLSFPYQQNSLELPQSQLLQADSTEELVGLVCQKKKRAKVVDHLSFNQMPKDSNREFFLWPRKPRFTHLIEACYQNC